MSRPETCPTCGSESWWVYISPCDGGIHDGWHAPERHEGRHVSPGWATTPSPDAAPPPAPSRVEEARRHASVVKHLFLLRHAHGLLLQHKVPANPDQHAKFLREIDALLDAERDEKEGGK